MQNDLNVKKLTKSVFHNNNLLPAHSVCLQNYMDWTFTSKVWQAVFNFFKVKLNMHGLVCHFSSLIDWSKTTNSKWMQIKKHK